MGRAAKIGIALWLLFAGVLLVQITRQTRDRVNLDSIREIVREEVNKKEKLMVTTVNWKDSAGHTQSTQVPSTPQGESESYTDYAKRHLQDVADFKAEVVAQGGTIL